MTEIFARSVAVFLIVVGAVRRFGFDVSLLSHPFLEFFASVRKFDRVVYKKDDGYVCIAHGRSSESELKGFVYNKRDNNTLSKYS